jgi:hypothetical protein
LGGFGYFFFFFFFFFFFCAAKANKRTHLYNIVSGTTHFDSSDGGPAPSILGALPAPPPPPASAVISAHAGPGATPFSPGDSAMNHLTTVPLSTPPV